jgi:glycosyltransferase involved in cell wall biosynthesis
MKNNKLLLLFPGPEYHIKTEKLESLSNSFTGTVVTSSPRVELQKTTQVGSFRYCCFNVSYKSRPIANLKYMALVILFAIRERIRQQQKYNLVVTYDPLKTGILGAICSIILGCKFAPEVNGVYHCAAEYLDGPRFSTFLKKIAYPIIQRIVLSKANGVKTLFPGQVDKVVGDRDVVIRSFPNHVEIDKFLTLPLDVSSPVILFVGFPFKRKGVDILINAFKIISSEFPQWELRIVGWYPDRRLLNSYIDSHPKIKYFLPVEYSEIPSLISECSIFVLPSRSEAMGRVLVETMAAGKVRIGARVDGIPYVIEDGVDGLLFEKENASDLADVLKSAILDNSLRAKLALNGRLRAEKFFTKEEYVENIINFYKKVINK